MDTSELDDLVLHVRAVFDSWNENTTLEEMRAGWESLFHGTKRVVGATAQKIESAEFEGDWIVAPEAEESRAIVYLHGGGYVIGSINSYRDMCERLSRAAKAAVLAVDYRLAPEHPFPAAVEDSISAYRWVLARGIKPERIAIAGDSAGGALTLAVMFLAKQEGYPMPACGVPISPWVDLEHTGETMVTMDAVEPMCYKAVLEGCARLYCQTATSAIRWLRPFTATSGAFRPCSSPSEGTKRYLTMPTALSLWRRLPRFPSR